MGIRVRLVDREMKNRRWERNGGGYGGGMCKLSRENDELDVERAEGLR
jgi:hypothetical protein